MKPTYTLVDPATDEDLFDFNDLQAAIEQRAEWRNAGGGNLWIRGPCGVCNRPATGAGVLLRCSACAGEE